jgi:hypothetical protein
MADDPTRGVIAEERLDTDHPLVEVALFRSPPFVRETIQATVANFALFGLLFVVAQYFESVDGVTRFGTGLRLLPMIAGLVNGTQIGGPLARRVGAGIEIAVGSRSPPLDWSRGPRPGSAPGTRSRQDESRSSASVPVWWP